MQNYYNIFIMNNLKFKQVTNFIKDIKISKDVDEEKSIVDKKLNKIRDKFQKPLSGEQTKRYIMVLGYIDQLGYNVNFG